jgi:DNA invertase Pin-like site-specific DNA recombinase
MDECRAYADNRRLEVVGEYVDGGVSGKYANRPGLDRLMADCRAGIIDVVIVAKHDRFGRSFRHTVALIGELEELGIEFVSIAERIDDTPSGRFQRNVLLSVAEFERERILERTTAGMERSVVEGRWITGRPPFGWRLVPGERGRSRIEIDPDAVPVWERIAAALVDRGLSTYQTARELNHAGVRTPRGFSWTGQTIYNLVNDAQGLEGTWTYRRPDRAWAKPGDGPPIPIPIPAIFTTERAAALRQALARRSRTRKPIKTVSLLSGRLRSACGHPMWVMRKVSGDRYYRCAGKRATDGGGKAVGDICDCHNIDAANIEEHVWSIVAEALSDPDGLLALAAEQAGLAAQTTGMTADDLAVLDRRIARLERAAATALADALAQGLDMTVAAGAVKNLQSRLDDARAQRSQVAAWAASAQQVAGRANTLTQIATETSLALSLRPFCDAHRRVIDVLDLLVEYRDWTACSTCGGTGRIKGVPHGSSCPPCVGLGGHPVLSITGHLPRLGVAESPWPVTLAAAR